VSVDHAKQRTKEEKENYYCIFYVIGKQRQREKKNVTVSMTGIL
jgi:hypothetical protein